MRLQVFYGGTFDPVHNGHLAIARAARDALDAQVWLLPAADPPHKGATHADAIQRARMLDLALAGEAGLATDRRELRREGPSYTVDTLRELRSERGPRAPLVWLIGSDSLVGLHSWHRWRELFDYAHVLVVDRPGSQVDSGLRAYALGNGIGIGDRVLARDDGGAAFVPGGAGSQTVSADQGVTDDVRTVIAPRWRSAAALCESAAGGFAVLALPQLRRESSTGLRQRIATAEPWQHWVPTAVAGYIVRHRLYAGRAGTPAPV